MSVQIGEVVDGKYRVLERLGAGGMGEVYKVEHTFLKAIRVIKVIRPQISEAADAHDRFLREAQLATKVQHPNVATLHDFSALPDGSHYMVWEYIEGENLAQVIRRRGILPAGESIQLAIQSLAGLEAIHRAGIIHRDISPENLMITGTDRVKIIDLGVAKAEQGDYAVTQTGMFVGKLRYSSPEQLGFLQPGEKIDARADLYSLGVVLFEMLTGRPPFEATSPHQYFLQHAGGTNVQPLDLARVPDRLRPILARALERDRNRRFANAREFGDALEHVAARLPTQEDDTLRVTPLPAPLPAAAPTEIVAQPRARKRQTALFLVIALVMIVFGALVTWHYMSRPAPASAIVTNTIAAPKDTPASSVTVQVSPPPAPAPMPVPVPVPTSVPVPAPVVVAPVPVAPKKPAQKAAVTETEAPEEPLESETVPMYLEGGVGARNDSAIAAARERLHNVTRVALDARGDTDLVAQLRDRLAGLNLTVVDRADVIIRFYGTVTHLRFGRKMRAGEATILKNGRPIFRYQMKAEQYRVGDNPAEAFARVLSDVFR
ncbi:MAG: hypothetical protein DMF58_13435 [Acidobacteria bacterium]|nr:MAG: hypothetical protein DMF58_13435 [Acidobacteriota bacterium]